MEVNWANGITTKVAPYKVFRIEKHEGSSVISIPQETNVDELPQEMIEHRSLPSDKKEKDLLNSDGVRENCEKQFGECSSFSLPRAAFELFSSIKASIFQTLGATPLSGAVSSVPTYEEENRSDFPNKDLKTCNQCTHSHQVDKLQFIEEITPNPEVVKTHEHNNFLFLVYRSFVNPF
ncbi:probable ubiquitin-conjugating enzyme E2 24 [Arachis duranensis]|uniref:Probable ubiquitin-conjugating enzyme E2 24 n=1 Tax=Arachis duranensis TaxID=130453 RepID=A0A9C6WS19_ARADU|nr:probable ubiquitin-conjugating enzyme E2 24 [Arachis duranensis]